MNIKKPNAKQNDPAKAGQRASRPVCFGELSRYSVFAVHTRFDSVAWFVQDVQELDDAGLPLVMRICATFDDAVKGF